MPICNKPPPQALASKSAAEVDDHASEAAKVKRTREQAYFNSYNFDAIEVLPYDEDDEDDTDEKSGKNRAATLQKQHTHTVNISDNESVVAASSALHQRSLPLHHVAGGGVGGVGGVVVVGHLPPNASLSSSSRRSSSQSSSNESYTHGHHHHHTNRMQYTYLQRLGSFFVTTNAQSSALTPAEDGGSLAPPIGRRSSNAVAISARSNSNSNEGIVSGKNNNKDEENGNFLLPRAMLKFQSVGSSTAAANSLPMAANTAAQTGGIDKVLHQNGNSGNNNNSNSGNATNNNNSKQNIMMTTTANNSNHNMSINANILRSSSNTGNMNNNINNKTRLNYTNSNNISTGFLIAKKEIDSATAIATATTAAFTTTTRNKKQSTSSTITSISTSTSSVVSVEHKLQKPPAIAAAGISNSSRDNILNKMKSTLSSSSANAIAGSNNSSSAITKRAAAAATTAEIGEHRGRTSSHSQSHYSTDKSGSSGYYSSNVCSTYSLEDHIYCEPVIDILDLSSKSKSVVGGSGGDAAGKVSSNIAASQQKQHPTTLHTTAAATAIAKTKTRTLSNKVNENAAHPNSRNRDMNSIGQSNQFSGEDCNEIEDDDDDDDDEDDVAAVAGKVASNLGKVRLQINLRRPYADYPHQHPNDSQQFSENLRILETSIENLDRHLKNFPSLSSQERVVSFVQQTHTHTPYLHHASDAIGGEKLRGTAYHLPTIMEVYDPTNQTPPPRPWQETTDTMDDSLLDIDLDSFLLVDERRCDNSSKHLSKSATKQSAITADGGGSCDVGGIDNPTFLTDEQEENNYKCVKYINSCPEDAYRVESDIVVASSGTGGTISEKSASVDHYLKRYEDQLHFQSTRELLEDVRDKIRLLSQSAESSSSNNSHQTKLHTDEDLFPKELESMIKALKHELESYLERMNQHSELEIRQLCSGLVKNQNIVKMKKAFERRRSTISVSADCEYEAIRDGVGGDLLVPISGVPISIRQQITSIRCASDPNFKMKRKSLAEVFPVADCYADSLSVPPQPLQMSSSGSRATKITQLQRNLSFHQPILNQLDAQVNPNGLHAIGGGGLSSGSGAESGESADKDSILEWHRKKPSIWEMYYGTNRMNQSLLGKRMAMTSTQATMSYPSSRPESDFTLDLPRAEQLRIKMEKEKKFRQRCRYITTFLSLIFFLLTVMVVSLVLSRGKRMFGSMI